MTDYRLNLRIDHVPDMQADVKQWRVRSAYRKAWKRRVRAMIGDETPDALLKVAAIRLTRHTAVMPDYDGLVAGFKPIIDALLPDHREGFDGVIENDRLDNLMGFDGDTPEYRWEQTKRGVKYITVEIVGVDW